MSDLQRTRRLLLAGLAVIALLILTVVFFLLRPSSYKKSPWFVFSPFVQTAQDAQERTNDSLVQDGILGGRKNIYDSGFKELAVSFRTSSVYARPLELRDPETVAAELAGLLALDEKELFSALKAERSFVWLGRHLAANTAKKIEALGLKGIYFVEEQRRFYPNHDSAAHVIGLFKDDQGLSGIEFYYDGLLRGGGGYGLHPSISEAVAESGAHLFLTLDLRLQSLLEDGLKNLIKETGAMAGMAVVMDPSTGAIPAMVSLPGYDPNRFWEYDEAAHRNRVLADSVYLGAINRLFCMAASSGSSQLQESSSSGTEETALSDVAGTVSGPETRKDAKVMGKEVFWVQQASGVMASPEIAAVKECLLPDQEAARIAERLGFYGKSGIDLPEEGFRADDEKYRLNAYTSPTTTLHLLAVFSRLINGGLSITPHLLRGYWDQQQKQEIPVDYVRTYKAFTAEASENFLSFLKDSARMGPENSVVLESLVEEKSISHEKTSELDIAYAPSVQKQAVGEAENQGDQVVALACAPCGRPEFALVVVLEGADIDTGSPSPVRAMVNKFIPKALKLAREDRLKQAVSFAETRDDEDIYRKWRKMQIDLESQPALPHGRKVSVMPELIGLSLRKALQVLQPYGLQLKVIGSGRVVSQDPPAGSPVTGGECVLELRVDREKD